MPLAHRTMARCLCRAFYLSLHGGSILTLPLEERGAGRAFRAVSPGRQRCQARAVNAALTAPMQMVLTTLLDLSLVLARQNGAEAFRDAGHDRSTLA